eukprot:5049809-Pleurochrysis_carterae.AAC.1
MKEVVYALGYTCQKRSLAKSGHAQVRAETNRSVVGLKVFEREIETIRPGGQCKSSHVAVARARD